MGTAVYSLQDLLFSVSLAAYVVTSVIVAAVRWGHKCPAFASHADYYYPAWKVIVGCYFANLLMAPAIFLPHEADAILQLRMLLILASPFFCALLMFSYFGKMLGKSSWRWPVYALIGPFAAMALAARRSFSSRAPSWRATSAACSSPWEESWRWRSWSASSWPSGWWYGNFAAP